MNEVKNKSSAPCEDTEAIKREFRRTVKDYSKIIDMIDATPQFEESTPKGQPYSLRKLLKRISKHFKNTNK